MDPRRALAPIVTVAALAVALVVAVPRPAPAGAAPVVSRLAGDDRYATAAAISQATFSPGVAVAYVATGEGFADGLAAGAAAAARRGPVLLATASAVPAVTAAELTRLRPAQVVVLGGPGALSDAVVTAVGSVTSSVVRRVAGDDRYATAAAVSADTFSPGVGVVHVASGLAFADALAAGPAAGVAGGPVLLIGPGAIPATVAAELTRLRPAAVRIVGGPAVVPTGVEAQLAAFSPAVTRVAGDDRYATAAALAQVAFPATAVAVHLATGVDYPDALAGAPAAALAPGPILLVQPGCIPVTAQVQLARLAPARLVLLGGPGALGAGVEQGTACGTGTGPVGYVGCSNTWQTVQGYHLGGGQRLWPALPAYGGGTVVTWGSTTASAGDWWPTFRASLTAQPTGVIWWQLCIRNREDAATSYTNALVVRAEIERSIPGAVVYVSAINGFVAPHVCSITGPDGVARAEALAARLVAEGRARPGPDVGDLRADQTTDGCHPNDAARPLLGAAVKAFFG